MTRRSPNHPPELRERVVRMVTEVTPNHGSQWAAIGVWPAGSHDHGHRSSPAGGPARA